jgi:[protein-PII] uridylyltransferase
MNSYLKEENIIGCIDLNDNNEIRSNTLAQLKRFKKNISGKIEVILKKNPYLAPESLSVYTLMNDIIIQSVSKIVTEYIFPLVSPTKGEYISVVALGGYARAEMAPYSDIDLLFLTPYKQTAWSENVIETILYLLWDLGLKVGHSVRNIDECLRIAKTDITARTSLLENRFLFGSIELANELNKKLWKDIFEKSAPEFIEKKLEERNLRHKKQGSERYLLEPNIKEGKGGLRDLQTLYWISKYVYKISDKNDLINYKIFTKNDMDIFFKAEDFLWTIRCALHIFTKRANEILSFDLQVPLAKSLGFKKGSGLLAVENFMQTYFLHAKNVGELTRILLAKMESLHVKKNPSFVSKLKNVIAENNLKLDKGFFISNGRVDVNDSINFEKYK